VNILEKVRVELPYGKGKLTFNVPKKNLLYVGEPRSVEGAPDVAKEILWALRNPIKSERISEIAERGKKVVLICDDYTRATPTYQIVPAVLHELNQAGIKDADIKLLVACGIHRKMTEEELTKKYGKEVLSKVEVVQHDASDQNQLEYLGVTKRGTPVWVDKAVVKSDIKIGIGLVESHPYTGFGGGPKIVAIGAAGKKTIYYNHLHLAQSPEAWYGKTDSNPCWLDLLEVARIAGLDMVINVVMNANLEVVKAYAGEPAAAQREAIKLFLDVYGREFPERADVVITSANPKDMYFDQCNIAMLNASNIVKDGGVRIVAGYCSEGLGPPNIRKLYLDSLARPWPTPEEYMQEAMEGKHEDLADVPAIYKWLKLYQKSDLIFVTEGLSEEDANSLRIDWTRSMEEAVQKALKRYGEDAKISVLPWGGMALPYLKE